MKLLGEMLADKSHEEKKTGSGVEVFILFLCRILILVSHLLWKRFHAKGNCPCGTENKLADKNLKYFSDGKIQCLLLFLFKFDKRVGVNVAEYTIGYIGYE